MRFGFVLMALCGLPVWAQHGDAFRQLDEVLPTPNVYRNASGAPGPQYWQQRVNYVIKAELDPETHWIHGSEFITYENNSPDTLTYLWLQLDQNTFQRDSPRALTKTMRTSRRSKDLRKGELDFDGLDRIVTALEFDGGHRITSVRSGAEEDMRHVINGTMMRVDLPEPLKPGSRTSFSIEWNYPIVEHRIFYSRAGREYFEDDDNWLYEIAQWFPRLAVYSDSTGWQNKQFLSSEFALEFGDYDVSLTVPEDYIVASTGELQNPKAVLTATQRARLEEARDADAPVYIVTPEEATANEDSRATGTKTWRFVAKDVRDFAWAASRKFIWDAWGFEMDGHFTMAMSFWPKEGEPLWSQYSTHAVHQALETYGRMLFPLPYPVMISVNGPVGGMEYPMITFNGARPEEDGSYGRYRKYGLISVIIHEVGHNWLPMIINSDERQWTWMDEGTNTFMQFMAEQDWEETYPSRRGFPRKLVNYFRDPKKVAVMTDGDSILQLGNNAYGKVAVALNVLRESVLGRELFDFAWKEYGARWKFKKPEPADLFRTMEDATGTDLDWFWRGWFYSDKACDLAIDGLALYDMDTGDPDVDKAKDRKEEDEEDPEITRLRNQEMVTRVERHPELFDFYDDYDEHAVLPEEREEFQEMLEELSDREKELLKLHRKFYVAEFSNVGGLVMPLILQINYVDNTYETMRIPAEVWRYDAQHVSKLLVSEKAIASIQIDPYNETGDVDSTNNRFPREVIEKRFKVVPDEDDEKNPMQKATEREEEAAEDEDEDDEDDEDAEDADEE